MLNFIGYESSHRILAPVVLIWDTVPFILRYFPKGRTMIIDLTMTMVCMNSKRRLAYLPEDQTMLCLVGSI